MNQEEFDAFVEDFRRKSTDLLVSKGREYTGSDDRLANFKRGAADTCSTPLQVAWIYASKHLDAIKTYIREEAAGRSPNLSEPIQGRLHDAVNYFVLLAALIQEQDDAKPKPTRFHAPYIPHEPDPYKVYPL